MQTLLTSNELDRMLRYPAGRSRRLAREGLIPHVRLPDGEIRFAPDETERWLEQCAGAAEAPAVNEPEDSEQESTPGASPTERANPRNGVPIGQVNEQADTPAP